MIWIQYNSEKKTKQKQKRKAIAKKKKKKKEKKTNNLAHMIYMNHESICK